MFNGRIFLDENLFRKGEFFLWFFDELFELSEFFRGVQNRLINQAFHP